MSDPFRSLEQEIAVPQCLIHNKPAVFLGPEKENPKTLLCLDCFTDYKKVNEQVKENQKVFFEMQQNNKQLVNALNKILTLFQEYKEKIISDVNKITMMLEDQVLIIINKQTIHNDLFKQSPATSIQQILQENKYQYDEFQNFSMSILEKLTNVKINLKVDSLIKSWKNDEVISNFLKLDNNTYYKEICNPIYQNEECWAIAINSTNSMIIVGSQSKIKVFEFLDEKLKLYQVLDDHSQKILCLRFMKKSGQFISGCQEGRIIIWKQNNDKKWFSSQIIEEHKGLINCIQINIDENLFITGGDDKLIKFWEIHQNKWNCDQSISFSNEVRTMSLHNSNTMLIARIYKSLELNIIEKLDSKWQLTQKIKLAEYSLRFQFMNDNQFAAQLHQSKQLLIFYYDSSENQFKQQQIVTVKYGQQEDYFYCPMQYIQSKGILLCKNCQYLNILKKNKNGEFILDQTIDYGGRTFCGQASDDGEYLFSWDNISKEIQTRKLIERD